MELPFSKKKKKILFLLDSKRSEKTIHLNLWVYYICYYSMQVVSKEAKNLNLLLKTSILLG